MGFLTPTIEAIGNIHPLRQAGGVIPTKVTSRHLEVEGWALFPDSEIARVEIAVNGVIVGRARLGLSRPDIAESHRHPSADRCGFYHFINEGELPSNPGVSAEFRVGGVALSDDGRRLEFEPLRVVRVRPSFEDRLAANRLFRHVLLLRRPLQDPSKDRDQALREEVDFWYQYLATGGRRWPEQFVQSIDPTAEVTDPILREVLSELPEEEVSILDVGAGPATSVGYRFPGKRLEITPVDPLADAYRELWTELGMKPPVWTVAGEGEHLADQFGKDSFEVVYARNAIDHVVDASAVIKNMLATVRSGGYIVMRHVRNEAKNANYTQLHQWNFDERDGHFVLWRRRGHELDLTELLANQAEVRCARDGKWVTAVLHRAPLALS